MSKLNAVTGNDSNRMAEIRLSELIWRTIKLRVSILLLFLLGLLLLLAAMEKGGPAVQQLDTNFCRQILIETRTSEAPGLNPDTTCTPRSARNFIESSMVFYRAVSGSLESGKATAKGLDVFSNIVAEYSDYAARRKAVFSMSIAPPYAGNPISVNALSIADVLPFCVLAVFALLLALGSQQKCYEKMLSATLREEKSASDRALGSSLAQLYAGTLRGAEHFEGTVLLYRRPITIRPETLVLGALLCASALVSLRILADYDPTSTHPTASIFFSYYFLLFCAATLLCGLVIETHSLYASLIAQRVGAPVRSARLFWLERIRQKIAHSLEYRTVAGIQLNLALSAAAVLLGFAFLFLPWTQPRVLAGYQFLIPQKPVPGLISGGPLHLPVFYPVDPRVFREIRYQMFVALLFLMISLAHAILASLKARRFGKPLLKVRVWLGYLVAFLAANYLFYMAVLQYESQTPDPRAVRDYLFNSDIVSPRGLPMILYDPAYGFWGFACCCAALVILSEVYKRQEQSEKGGPRR
jgi:hypothetical protein